MSSLSLIARLLIAILFVHAGVRKIMAFQAVSAMLAGRGFPASDVMLALTIVVEIGGGLLLLYGPTARFGAVILSAFTLAAAVIFHDFWNKLGAPPVEYTNQLNHFLKNISIIGGLLYIVAHPPQSRVNET